MKTTSNIAKNKRQPKKRMRPTPVLNEEREEVVGCREKKHIQRRVEQYIGDNADRDDQV